MATFPTVDVPLIQAQDDVAKLVRVRLEALNEAVAAAVECGLRVDVDVLVRSSLEFGRGIVRTPMLTVQVFRELGT